MVSPTKRRMQYKNKRTPSGTKREYFKAKHKKSKCAITGKTLAGMPNETKANLCKHSKTEKRPSAPFGGILSGEARHDIFVELAKVEARIKKMDEVDEKHRKYVKQAEKRAALE